MYDYKWASEVVTKAFCSGRAYRVLARYLKKTESDVVFLLQFSPKGWQFFKDLARWKPFKEVCEGPEGLIAWGAFKDIAFEKFYEKFFIDQKTANSLQQGELEYLTKFFAGIMLEERVIDTPRA